MWVAAFSTAPLKWDSVQLWNSGFSFSASVSVPWTRETELGPILVDTKETRGKDRRVALCSLSTGAQGCVGVSVPGRLC